MSGAAWTLPVGWDTASMGRLVDIQSGFACAKKNLVPASMGVAHLRPFNVGTDGKVDLSEVYYIPPDFKHNVEDYALEPGHILFNNTNSVELVGKTALVTEPMPATFSNHIYRLALKQKAKRRLEPAWLALALRRLWAMGYFAEQCNRWIGQAGFNATKLKEVAIPLPPLDEQRRIVARIDALFDRIDEAQRLRVAAEVDADRFLDAALSDMFAGSETEDWKQRPFKDVWKEKARYGSFETPHVVETDYPVIRVGNLVDGVLVFDDLRYLSLSEKQLRRCELVDGDVIIARAIGSRAHLGKCAVFRPPSTEKTFVLDSHLIRVRVNRTVDPDYVRYYLSSLPGRDEILRNSRQSAIQFNINVGELSRVRLPLPPLPEQRRIVDYLDGLQAQVAELKRLQAASAVELERLSGAVLTRALKGEL